MQNVILITRRYRPDLAATDQKCPIDQSHQSHQSHPVSPLVRPRHQTNKTKGETHVSGFKHDRRGPRASGYDMVTACFQLRLLGVVGCEQSDMSLVPFSMHTMVKMQNDTNKPFSFGYWMNTCHTRTLHHPARIRRASLSSPPHRHRFAVPNPAPAPDPEPLRSNPFRPSSTLTLFFSPSIHP